MFDAIDVVRIADSHALAVFRKTKGRPTFIVLDSHIGYGSPHKQDTAAAHGEPLGEAEVRLSKKAYGFPEDAKFFVPEGLYDHFTAGIGKRGAEARQKWASHRVLANAKVQILSLWAVSLEIAGPCVSEGGFIGRTEVGRSAKEPRNVLCKHVQQIAVVVSPKPPHQRKEARHRSPFTIGNRLGT